MKILILGASGVFGTSMEDVCKEKGIEYLSLSHDDFEITNFEENHILKHNCDVIVNGVGMMGINPCEENPVKAFAINSASVNKLAKICQENELTLIQPSSHAVFGGAKAESHNEESIPYPTSIYGISKYASELIAISACDKKYILRFPALFGRRRNEGTGFIDKLPQLLKDGEIPQISVDKRDSLSYGKDVVKKIIDLLEEKKPYGIYHIANEGFPSYYEFACKLRDLYGLNNEIKKATDSDFKSMATKPVNTRMTSIKIPLLRRWEEALEEFVNED